MDEIVRRLFALSWWKGLIVFFILFLVFAVISMFIPMHRFDNSSLPREFTVRYILHFLYSLAVTIVSTLVLFAFSYYQLGEADLYTKAMLGVIVLYRYSPSICKRIMLS